MTILCGTDFSESSQAAARVAALMAAKSKQKLKLVHVADLRGTDALRAGLLALHERTIDPESPQASRNIRQSMKEIVAQLPVLLAKEARRLAPSKASILTEVLEGVPDATLAMHAKKIKARLVVVGALGHREPSTWQLGSTADRIAQTSPAPVLVVRDARPFEEWLAGRRSLRVMIAVDASESCDAAVRWMEELVKLGACDIRGGHVYWPPDARAKGGQKSSIPIGAGHPDVEKRLRKELGARLAALPEADTIVIEMIGGLGQPAEHLVTMARDAKADLVVVGSHQRSGLGWFWHGSVSYGVIDRAPMSVLCVPMRKS